MSMFTMVYDLQGVRCEAVTARSSRCTRLAYWKHIEGPAVGHWACHLHLLGRRGWWNS